MMDLWNIVNEMKWNEMVNFSFRVGRLYRNRKTVIKSSAEVCGKSCIAVFHHTLKWLSYVHNLHAVEPACKTLEDVGNYFPVWGNISSVFVYSCYILTIQSLRIT